MTGPNGGEGDSRRKRCVGYVRVSSDEQVADCTQENQHRDLARDCARDGVERVEVYEDLGVSGASVRLKDRRGWKQLVTRVQAGDVDEIRVRDITRITRETGFTDLGTLHEMMREHGLTLVLASGGRFTADNWAALCQLAIQSLGAAGQLQGQRTLLNSGKRKAVDKGIPIGGPAPFGLTWTRDARGKGHWSMDERYAPLIRRMFELCVEGHSVAEIAELLNAGGIMPRGARRWHPSWVARILKREVYCGRYKQAYMGHTCTVEIPVRIVDPDLFDRAQSALRSRRNLPAQRGDVRFLCRHLLRCGECNALMWAQAAFGNAAGRYYCKKCSSSGRGSPYWRRDHIDDVVWVTISHALLDADDLLTQVAETTAEADGRPAHAQVEREARDELATIVKRQEAVERWMISGSISVEKAEALHREADQLKRVVEARLASTGRARIAAEQLAHKRVSVAEQIDRLRFRVAGADATARREILLTVVPPDVGSIIVHKGGRIEIRGVLPTVVEASPACRGSPIPRPPRPARAPTRHRRERRPTRRAARPRRGRDTRRARSIQRAPRPCRSSRTPGRRSRPRPSRPPR